MNINTDQTANLNKIVQETKTIKIYQQILDNLEEAVIIYRDNQIDFQNQVFSEMIRRIKITDSSHGRRAVEVEKIRFLKIYRNQD